MNDGDILFELLQEVRWKTYGIDINKVTKEQLANQLLEHKELIKELQNPKSDLTRKTVIKAVSTKLDLTKNQIKLLKHLSTNKPKEEIFLITKIPINSKKGFKSKSQALYMLVRRTNKAFKGTNADNLFNIVKVHYEEKGKKLVGYILNINEKRLKYRLKGAARFN